MSGEWRCLHSLALWDGFRAPALRQCCHNYEAINPKDRHVYEYKTWAAIGWVVIAMLKRHLRATLVVWYFFESGSIAFKHNLFHNEWLLQQLRLENVFFWHVPSDFLQVRRPLLQGWSYDSFIRKNEKLFCIPISHLRLQFGLHLIVSLLSTIKKYI